MSFIRFQQLCDELCYSAGLEPLCHAEDERGFSSMSIRLQDVDVTLLHLPRSHPGSMMVLVDFGAMPPDREVAAWEALMDLNFLMCRDGAMSFGRSPSAGRVVLQCAYRLDEIEAVAIWHSLVELVGLARAWNEDHFLPPQSGWSWPRTGSPALAAGHA